WTGPGGPPAPRWAHASRWPARPGSPRNAGPYISASILDVSSRPDTPATRPTAVSARPPGTLPRGWAAALVLSRISERTVPGWRAAMRIAANPPIDSPARWTGTRPSARITA